MARLPAPRSASIEADANWIASAQLPDGALANYPFNGTSAVIQPYMSNYGAIGLAEATVATGDSTYAGDAWNWLSWYAAHMDATTGYVTDYDYQNGVETSTGSFDSTDAYAGTFLAAAWDTYSAQPSSAKLAQLLPAIKLAVQAIESTQQPDGLTWATPGYHAKYLMDNAEVYGGLVGAENLARAAGDNSLAAEATQDATSCFDGIQALWNAATNSYDWARAGADTSTDTLTDWSVLYPDAFEQMWAIAWDATTSSHAATVLSQFATNQPNWDVPTDTAPELTNATVSPAQIGYWPFAATAYVAVGDPADDETAATSLQTALDGPARRGHGTRAWRDSSCSHSPSPARSPRSTPHDRPTQPAIWNAPRTIDNSRGATADSSSDWCGFDSSATTTTTLPERLRAR